MKGHSDASGVCGVCDVCDASQVGDKIEWIAEESAQYMTNVRAIELIQASGARLEVRVARPCSGGCPPAAQRDSNSGDESIL